MQTTANLGLKKPEGTDIVNIDDLNYNADILDSKAKELQDNKVDKVTGKGLSTNDYTTAEKNKLAGIATGAQTNQNAFSNVKVGTSIVAADNATDTLELIAGTNITLTPDTTNDKVTIAVTNPNAFRNVKVGTTTIASDAVSDTFEMVAGTNISIMPDATNDKITINNTYTHPGTHPASMIVQDASNRMVTDAEKAVWNSKANTTVATTSENGLMSSADKSKLDGIAGGAEVNQNTFANVKVGTTTISADAKSDTLELVAGTNISLTPDATNDKVTINSTYTYTHPSTHPASMITQDASNRFVSDTEKAAWNGKASTAVATTSANGLMSSTDKSKLDGIATGANNYVHPSSHPASMITQDASNRFVTDTEKSTWNGKASTAVVTTSSNGLMSSADKSKLDGIDAGANNYSLPTATSTVLGGVKSGGDITITSGLIYVNDDSHNHVISNIDGLQTALDAKAPTASPTFTGTPKAPSGATDYTTPRLRNIYFSLNIPTSMASGDICLTYE